ncbi:MAG: hypothetical protein KIT09_32775 [Bryobacteraceae bacterium]|nr:hypothetical protein [Bryobacteraceae bacterium]
MLLLAAAITFFLSPSSHPDVGRAYWLGIMRLWVTMRGLSDLVSYRALSTSMERWSMRDFCSVRRVRLPERTRPESCASVF